MNAQKSLLRITVISLVLLSNSISFGMIMRYKNEEVAKSVMSRCKQWYHRFHYGPPLLPEKSSVTLANILDWKKEAEKKENAQELSLEEQGKRNLVKLYANRGDSQFVAKFLCSHYVPMVLLETAPRCQNGQKIECYTVNPYSKSFYPDSRAQLIGDKTDWKLLKQKRFNDAKAAIVYESEKNNKDIKVTFRHLGSIKSNLVNATLFGNDEDVKSKLAQYAYSPWDIKYVESDLYRSIIAAIGYPNKKNNALELLLQRLKLLTPKIENFDNKGSRSYNLLSLSAKNRHAFALLSEIDPYNTNNYIWDMSTNLDRMIIDKNFDEENIRIYKKNGGMTIEEHGRHNLEILYKNQNNPQFVSKFLLSDYVPILFVETAPVFGENSKSYNYFVIDPYDKSFYTNPGHQFFGNEKESNEIVLKRYKESKDFFDKINKQKNGKCFINSYKISNLMKVTLFGDNENISEELAKTDNYDELYDATMSAISSPNKKNNALELLLQKIQLLQSQGSVELHRVRAWHSYSLLFLAAKNEKAFELISRMDPYKMNMCSWATSSVDSYYTNLERMLDDKNFDEENIRVYRDNGGMTTKEVHFMSAVGKILKNLPSRNIQLTSDEELSIRPFRQFGVVHEFDVVVHESDGVVHEFDVD